MIASFTRRPTLDQIEVWAEDRDYTVLQTHGPVLNDVWSLLDEAFFSRRPDVMLRVYGFYGEICDLSFAAQMTNVERFAANSLSSARNIERVAEMPRLKELSVGVFDLADFGFLYLLPDTLTWLALSATSSKKPRIDALSGFKSLRTLYLEGQQKGIEAVAELPLLEELTLRSISLPNLDFLSGLSRLWSLDIKLGGARNLEALSKMTGIKYLELWQIQKFEDLSPVAEMPGLQNLFLQSLPLIERLPDLARATALRRITLDSLKGLKSVAEAATAPNLEDFAQIAGPSLDPAAYESLLNHPKLRRMLVSGDGRRNRVLIEQMRERGIQPIERLYAEEAFVYR